MLTPEKGRPFDGEAKKDTTIRLRMEPIEVKQLDECALRLNTTRSGAIREGLRLLKSKLDSEKK